MSGYFSARSGGERHPDTAVDEGSGMKLTSLQSIITGGLVSLGFVCLPISAQSHNLWMIPQDNGSTIYVSINYGDPDAREQIEPVRLAQLEVVSSAARNSLLEVPMKPADSGGSKVLLIGPFAKPSDSSVIAAMYETGFWVKTESGYRQLSKRLVADASVSFWAAKFSKLLLGSKGYTHVVGHELELVPLEDPFSLASGNALRVRAIFRGQPLADATIQAYDGVSAVSESSLPAFKTDSAGVASVTGIHDGLTVLTLEHKVPGSYPTLASEDRYSAVLSFDLHNANSGRH